MSQTISKIGIKNSSGTGYDTRDIGAKGQNVEVGYDASGKIILDVDTQTPTTTKQLTKVLQDAEKNISDLDDSKAPDNHAWSDADSGVNHGLADGTHYGHIKVGNGLTVNSGKVDVAYGNSANTACQGNDSRLSNARKNPKALTFSDGTTNTTYDGSAEKTVNAATIGAAPAGHTSVQATGSILGHVKTGTGITNSSGTISVSYGTAAGTACQGNDSRLSDARTPKSHAATATTYGSGTSSNYGHVKLTDTYSVTTPNASTNGANTGIAASAYALQQAYNTLNSNLKKTRYTFTAESGVVNVGTGLTIIKQAHFYHVRCSITFANVDYIENFSKVKFGTISDWTGEEVNPACIVNAIGYAPTSNPPALGVKIESDGSVYALVHGATSGIKNIWFYGFSTMYTYY